MNFDMDDRQKQIRKELRCVLAEESESLRELDGRNLAELQQVYRGLLKKLSAAGYLGIGTNPEAAGRSPYAGLGTAVPAGEVLAEGFPDIYLGVEISSRIVGGLLARYGSPELQDRYLVPLLKGEILGSVALNESLGNFPGTKITTQAEPQGEDFLLHGTKKGVINGSLADVIIVPALLEDRTALFIVSPGEEGVVFSEPYPALGYRRLVFADLTLNHCRVPREKSIDRFESRAIAGELQNQMNLAVTVSSLGGMHRTLSKAREYGAAARKGEKPPLAYQEIRYRLAEMFALYQTSQLLVYRAAWMLEAGSSEAHTVVDSAKVFVTESAEEVARGAMQMSALDGYLGSNALETGYRDARFGPVAGETSEVLRMRIADDCLRKYV
jgi:alkylation response protein AidB-like acyl-CoA dehydrogenase